MPYREIHIGQEVFVTRVPPEAIAEWLNIRDRNKLIGYPDRPPDVDTPLLRMWVTHPNEVNAFALDPATPRDTNTFPIYSIVVNGPLGVEVKLLVGFDIEANEYKFRHILRDFDGHSLGDETFSFPEELGGGAFDVDLEYFSNFPGGDEVYFISTYEDFESAQEETNCAVEELKEYYKDEDRLVN